VTLEISSAGVPGMKQSDIGTPGISAMHAGPIAVAPIIMRSDPEDWPDANGAAVGCGTSDMATAAEAMNAAGAMAR
jgi:hypothetical protein